MRQPRPDLNPGPQFDGRPSRSSDDNRRVPALRVRLAPFSVAVMLGVSAIGAGAATSDVIEYYNASQDHYFFTASQPELDALDSGRLTGWTRTGMKFPAYSRDSTGVAPVCRFYLPPGQGDSHFYSASAAECVQTRNKFPSFVEETTAAMYIHLPDSKTGACPARDAPVYRVWNKRADSNHRYTTDRAVRADMVARGWVAEGYGADQVAMCSPPKDDEPNAVGGAALPPPCKGTDPKVAVPGGPHGMYVWAPTQRLLNFLVADVIGKDPTLCGASLVIPWSSVETQKGVYDWTAVTTAAAPFTSVGLTVNLLFSDSTEGPSNTVTPAWVTRTRYSMGGDGVPTVTCTGEPTIPVYFNATYEADWSAFIAAAIHQFSNNNSALTANVGYMRFANAGGAEALPPPGYDGHGGACGSLWKNATSGYKVTTCGTRTRPTSSTRWEASRPTSRSWFRCRM